ncbi:MAG TPA: hypothetical protein PKH98_06855, partial [Candidatus Omnitrophota bacterium]|nr:hypothetical protein [Candidatus Omnitrophota bacterium]
GLIQRLDSILKDQELYAANVEERINRFSVFIDEVKQIRENALSVEFWRSRVPEAKKENILDFIIEVENPTKNDLNLKDQKNYLPTEIKTEHIVNAENFDIKYDPNRRRLYITKEEILKPKEKKRYQIGIIDVWSIAQEKIEDLKDRTREAYKLLEKTEYGNTASYLVKNIKENLTKIEDSQAIKKPIKEHISAFRLNEQYFASAQKDVQALEDLLRAVREHLERSPLKNVLQKITLLNTIAAIAAAIFGEKPLITTFWKIIIGIIIFVGILTIIHFTIWSKRSKGVKKEDLEEPTDQKTS